MKKLVNIRLDLDLWHEARVASVKEGITLQEWLTRAIQRELGRETK
jgi:hypothetical protein